MKRTTSSPQPPDQDPYHELHQQIRALIKQLPEKDSIIFSHYSPINPAKEAGAEEIGQANNLIRGEFDNFYGLFHGVFAQKPALMGACIEVIFQFLMMPTTNYKQMELNKVLKRMIRDYTKKI